MSSSTGSFARGDSLGADAFGRLDDLMEATGPSARARGGGGATGRSSAGASATTGASSGGNRLRGTLESLELAVRDHGHAIEVMRRDIASLMDEKVRAMGRDGSERATGAGGGKTTDLAFAFLRAHWMRSERT